MICFVPVSHVRGFSQTCGSPWCPNMLSENTQKLCTREQSLEIDGFHHCGTGQLLFHQENSKLSLYVHFFSVGGGGSFAGSFSSSERRGCSSWGAWASAVVVQAFSCSVVWNLPGQGSSPCSLHWQKAGSYHCTAREVQCRHFFWTGFLRENSQFLI